MFPPFNPKEVLKDLINQFWNIMDIIINSSPPIADERVVNAQGFALLHLHTKLNIFSIKIVPILSFAL